MALQRPKRSSSPPTKKEEDFQQVQQVRERPKKKVEQKETLSVPPKNNRSVDNEQFINKNRLEQDKFIDVENKKLIPFGGVKAKAKDFDARKNQSFAIKLWRGFIFLVIGVVLALGVKNTWFPEQIYTKSQIEKIAQLAVGDTGFPLERGQAFAEEFLYYYLNLNSSDFASSKALSRFFEGKVSDKYQDNKLIVSPVDNRQKAIYMPTTYEARTLSDKTAVYKVSAYITDETGSNLNAEQKLTSHWLSFAINVFYDKESDQLIIQKDSPILIPSFGIGKQTKLPAEKPIEESVDDSMREILTPTIDGFIKAFAKSSYESHNDVVQYIPQDKPVELITGFDNNLVLARDEKTSILKTVYSVPGETNEWLVDVLVDWRDNNHQDIKKSATYKSRYIMKIKKNTDDKYLVHEFKPYEYNIKED